MVDIEDVNAFATAPAGGIGGNEIEQSLYGLVRSRWRAGGGEQEQNNGDERNATAHGIHSGGIPPFLSYEPMAALATCRAAA